MKCEFISIKKLSKRENKSEFIVVGEIMAKHFFHMFAPITKDKPNKIKLDKLYNKAKLYTEKEVLQTDFKKHRVKRVVFANTVRVKTKSGHNYVNRFIVDFSK
jgi:hypothetical protein